MTSRPVRVMDRQNAFRQLARIFDEQSIRPNEMQFASKMRFFAKQNNIPTRNIFLFQKRLLGPLFVRRGRMRKRE